MINGQSKWHPPPTRRYFADACWACLPRRDKPINAGAQDGTRSYNDHMRIVMALILDSSGQELALFSVNVILE